MKTIKISYKQSGKVWSKRHHYLRIGGRDPNSHAHLVKCVYIAESMPIKMMHCMF